MILVKKIFKWAFNIIGQTKYEFFWISCNSQVYNYFLFADLQRQGDYVLNVIKVSYICMLVIKSFSLNISVVNLYITNIKAWFEGIKSVVNLYITIIKAWFEGTCIKYQIFSLTTLKGNLYKC
jgi:hypothetical protein